MTARSSYIVPISLLFAVAASSTLADPSGEIRGRVRLQVAGTSLADLGVMAVYLDPRDGQHRVSTTQQTNRILQKDASFDPPFLIVAAGQTIEMPNGDAFYHNVFSYSKPNDFDLGLYPMGESRSVQLRHPGVVHVYCSIHESMRAVVLVSPSSWYAVVDSRDGFHISGVPPGEYQLHTFSELLPTMSQPVVVRAGATTQVELEIEPDP